MLLTKLNAILEWNSYANLAVHNDMFILNNKKAIYEIQTAIVYFQGYAK